MMKLQFEQVLEYLLKGGDDPRIESMLEHDPDGPKMLRQAKLLHQMLKVHAEKSTGKGGPAPARGDFVAEASAFMGATAAPRFKVDDLFGEGSEFRDSADVPQSEIQEAQRLAQRVAGPPRKIGRLLVIIRGDGVILQRAQDKMAAGRTRKERPDLKLVGLVRRTTDSGVARFSGRDMDISVSVDRSDKKSQRIRFAVDNLRLNCPARGLSMVYVPEEGPFVEITTNHKGLAAMAVPEHSGVLRIETDKPQQLRIEIKK
jgi:hypothetical protein